LQAVNLLPLPLIFYNYAMKDKNTVIGIVLLAILFIVLFWYTNRDQQAYLARQTRTVQGNRFVATLLDINLLRPCAHVNLSTAS